MPKERFGKAGIEGLLCNKSQIQFLDRHPAGLPIKPGRSNPTTGPGNHFIECIRDRANRNLNLTRSPNGGSQSYAELSAR
jgi:hypothetical protein